MEDNDCESCIHLMNGFDDYPCDNCTQNENLMNHFEMKEDLDG